MDVSFENKVALVTGAGSGLGLATAKAFAEAGASVALADWNEKAVRSAAEELAGGRLGRAEEIADAVLWLCSPAASLVIGHALAIDGGYTVH